MSYKHFSKCVIIAAFSLSASVMFGQTGKLRLRVEPKQAYVFVDGVAYGDGNHTYRIASGNHSIGVYNYGFKPQVRDVTIDQGKLTEAEFKLEPVANDVHGPWGRIQIEGASVFAVLLNGKTPDYFVGHGDEFNHGGTFLPCCIQQLVVPAGTHTLTLVYKDSTLWSGTVTVNANERVLLKANKGSQRVIPWTKGQNIQSLPRFTARIASATVAIAPVSGNLVAQSAQINCGDSTQLNWTTAETVERTISSGGESQKQSAESGQLAMKPLQNTTYTLQASGPGGHVTSSTDVTVNTAVQSSLQASPAEIRYRKIGDKVLEQGSSNLSWTTSNASSVSVDPLGSVSANDSRAVHAAPQQQGEGSVNEVQSYILTAKNECGGSDTKTVAVRIVGSIEPIPTVPLASVFFPTGYPDESHPDQGLVQSQQDLLKQTADGFKKYLEYDPDAKLKVVGNTDERDANARNMPLSQRRADSVRQYLQSLGIPEDKIETVAQGKDHPLDADTVKALHEQNPNKPTQSLEDFQDLVWAYNRRVDIVLQPKGEQSTQYYPGTAPEAKLLLSREWPNQTEIVTQAAEKTPLPTTADPQQ
jgi:flagellar motor protein MotB